MLTITQQKDLKRGDIVVYKDSLVCGMGTVLPSLKQFLDVCLEMSVYDTDQDFWTTTEHIRMASDSEAMLWKLENE